MKIDVIEIKTWSKIKSLKEYLDKIKSYFRNIIINLEKSGTWKIQLTTVINFVSLKSGDEERAMHSESDNIKFM